MAELAKAETADSPLPWYALRVRSNFERKTSTWLENKGYEQFTPLYRSRRQWSDRMKSVELPLFPGYVFCRFDAQRRLPVLATPGVVTVVSFGREPTEVDEREIEAVRVLVGSGHEPEPWPYLEVGRKIRLLGGSLHGLEGLLIQVKNKTRLVVSVTLLQRSVAVEIDRESIEPVF